MHIRMSTHNGTNGKLLDGIGSKVRTLRNESHLTIKELSDRAGLSPRFVAQLEAGQGNISISRLADVATALGRPLQELLPPTSNDGSLHSEIWHQINHCTEEDLQELRDWLAERKGRTETRFIALVGLRGAGKSTVGAQLAKKLKMDFVEIDSLIERTAGMSLGEIFAIHGEDYYRRLEREVLARLFAESKGCVLATGGSIVTDTESWDIVKRRCFTIWLRATPQEHMNRVLRQGDTRPMRDNPSAMAELKSLLSRREPLYAQVDLVVKTSNELPQNIVSKISRRIERG